MRILLLTSALTVAGCAADGGFTGSPHGYSGKTDSPLVDMFGTPTILQPGETALHSEYGADGSVAEMPGTYSVDIAGNVTATGYPAYWMALASFCARAPAAPICANEP